MGKVLNQQQYLYISAIRYYLCKACLLYRWSLAVSVATGRTPFKRIFLLNRTFLLLSFPPSRLTKCIIHIILHIYTYINNIIYTYVLKYNRYRKQSFIKRRYTIICTHVFFSSPKVLKSVNRGLRLKQCLFGPINSRCVIVVYT